MKRKLTVKTCRVTNSAAPLHVRPDSRISSHHNLVADDARAVSQLVADIAPNYVVDALPFSLAYTVPGTRYQMPAISSI